MIVDFDQPVCNLDGIMTYPQTLAEVPKAPTAVKEQIVIRGTTAGRTIGVHGTADQEE